jgi:hypothetical protein
MKKANREWLTCMNWWWMVDQTDMGWRAYSFQNSLIRPQPYFSARRTRHFGLTCMSRRRSAYIDHMHACHCAGTTMRRGEHRPRSRLRAYLPRGSFVAL